MSPDRIDNLIGMFLLNRDIRFTTSGKPIHEFGMYRMIKDPADDKWFVLAEGEEVVPIPPPTAQA